MKKLKFGFVISPFIALCLANFNLAFGWIYVTTFYLLALLLVDDDYYIKRHPKERREDM